jgi:hypothetical protein
MTLYDIQRINTLRLDIGGNKIERIRNFNANQGDNCGSIKDYNINASIVKNLFALAISLL